MATTTTTKPRAERRPRNTKPAPVAALADTSAPAPADTSADTSAPPAGGYVLVRAACPARADTSRAARWPLLVQHAGQPNGKAALAAALKAGGYSVTAGGMLRWCARKGYVRMA